MVAYFKKTPKTTTIILDLANLLYIPQYIKHGLKMPGGYYRSYKHFERTVNYFIQLISHEKLTNLEVKVILPDHINNPSAVRDILQKANNPNHKEEMHVIRNIDISCIDSHLHARKKSQYNPGQSFMKLKGFLDDIARKNSHIHIVKTGKQVYDTQKGLLYFFPSSPLHAGYKSVLEVVEETLEDVNNYSEICRKYFISSNPHSLKYVKSIRKQFSNLYIINANEIKSEKFEEDLPIVYPFRRNQNSSQKEHQQAYAHHQ